VGDRYLSSLLLLWREVDTILVTMNAIRNLLNNIRGKASQAAAGGGNKLPNAGNAIGGIVTMGALGGIGYGAYHSMVTSKYGTPP
jgi:hypothetical protein